ncbi:MAG: hypothetical protein H0X24_25515 [Ktedonobacterales bacterium]|nr:hypothetical protein [Ktedonobacterales bacterium]
MLERSPATPLIAVIDPCEVAALPVLMTLAAANYATLWCHAAADVCDDGLSSNPDVVILASSHATRFDQWHAARLLHELDAAVIMATADTAARREVRTTPRGAAFVDSVPYPYDPVEILQAVQRAVRTYPANLHAPEVAQRTQRSPQGIWHGVWQFVGQDHASEAQTP